MLDLALAAALDAPVVAVHVKADIDVKVTADVDLPALADADSLIKIALG